MGKVAHQGHMDNHLQDHTDILHLEDLHLRVIGVDHPARRPEDSRVEATGLKGARGHMGRAHLVDSLAGVAIHLAID